MGGIIMEVGHSYLPGRASFFQLGAIFSFSFSVAYFQSVPYIATRYSAFSGHCDQKLTSAPLAKMASLPTWE